MPIHERAPGQAIALCLVPYQPEVRVALVVRGLGGVLAVVKDIHLCTDGLGCNQEGVLRHVARSVDLALVVYLLNHLDFACRIGRQGWHWMQLSLNVDTSSLAALHLQE